MTRALELIRLSKDCGADFVKFQCYLPESLTINCNNEHFIIKDPHSPWDGMTYWDLYEKAHTPRHWFPYLIDECKKINIKFMATPYCKEDLDFLEKYDCQYYKISAFEAVHPFFVQEVASTGKQIFLSVGHLNDEQASILYLLLKSKNKESILMHSISKYPPFLNECNFPRFKKLKEICPDIGFSDHTIDEWSTLTAIALGAKYIEKHFKNTEDCLDAHFSLDEWQLTELIHTSKKYYKNINAEIKDDRQHARSIFVIEDIQAGEKFTTKNIGIIRPSLGLDPDKLTKVFSSKATMNLTRGTPLQLSHLCYP